ncbi:hypothetical protein ACJX0J_023186, partial [Zea mays]
PVQEFITLTRYYSLILLRFLKARVTLDFTINDRGDKIIIKYITGLQKKIFKFISIECYRQRRLGLTQGCLVRVITTSSNPFRHVHAHTVHMGLRKFLKSWSMVLGLIIEQAYLLHFIIKKKNNWLGLSDLRSPIVTGSCKSSIIQLICENNQTFCANNIL